MALIKYEPWLALNDMQRMMNQLFESRMPALSEGDLSTVSTSEWAPSVDIKEEDDCFVLKADLPGVDPKDIDIRMEEGMLSIKGERESEEKQETKDYTRIERSKGTFYRRFALPDTADAENISAKSRNGVLELTIPKSNKVAATKKISVERAE